MSLLDLTEDVIKIPIEYLESNKWFKQGPHKSFKMRYVKSMHVDGWDTKYIRRQFVLYLEFFPDSNRLVIDSHPGLSNYAHAVSFKRIDRIISNIVEFEMFTSTTLLRNQIEVNEKLLRLYYDSRY